jgi:hypothetical protein
MKTCAGLELYLHAFLTSALDGGEWAASWFSYFTLRGKSPWYSLVRRLSGLQDVAVRKMSVFTETQIPIGQPITNHYTN